MDLLKNIKRHEGFRATVYKCTEGYETIGYGFAIKDLELTKEVAEDILIRKLLKLRLRLCKTFDWFIDSPKKVQDVVINMCYQMGLSGFSKFKKTIYYLETEQYEEASIEMLDSLWAKQTPNRAKELSEIVKSVSSN